MIILYLTMACLSVFHLKDIVFIVAMVFVSYLLAMCAKIVYATVVPQEGLAVLGAPLQ